MANEDTDAERERVRELFGIRSDRKIAETLIGEGYDGKRATTTDAKQRQLERVRRRVHRHREWWRSEWRKTKALTAVDRTVSTEEYVARLETRIAQLEEIIDDTETKGTPRVQALSELRQIEQAIAKARGSDTAPESEPEGDGGPRVPFIGLVMDLSAVSEKVAKKARGEDDGTD